MWEGTRSKTLRKDLEGGDSDRPKNAECAMVKKGEREEGGV